MSETFIISQLAGGHDIPASQGWWEYELNWTAWQSYKDTYKIDAIKIEFWQAYPVGVAAYMTLGGNDTLVGYLQDWSGGDKT